MKLFKFNILLYILYFATIYAYCSSVKDKNVQEATVEETTQTDYQPIAIPIDAAPIETENSKRVAAEKQAKIKAEEKAKKKAAKKKKRKKSRSKSKKKTDYSSWKNKNLPKKYGKGYAIHSGDVFLDENWNAISPREYGNRYRFFKHEKGLYTNGKKQAYKLEALGDSSKIKLWEKRGINPEAIYHTIGQDAPDFDLTDIYDNNYQLSDYAGKVVVLNFWFVSCAPCRNEMPELNQLVKKYKDNDDVVFIAPSTDSKLQIEFFLDIYDFDYALIGAQTSLAKEYGVPAYPANIVIGKDGKIKFVTVGGQVRGVMKRIIDQCIEEELRN